ncbi:uncharacterized protein [Ptychodera flava]|uniref:uncharacterized protein n=1 Tax=Ptychodera flava TaxID=63121 RepID=UPI003969C5BB
MSSMIREEETTGKEYDVFFSHDGTNLDDCAWVKEMAGKLERDHKLTCAFAERDFIPGKPVLKNMTRCVKKARVMVLVLSPSFVQSGWCTYEAQVGLTDHLTREQIMVVPVMREECTKPDFIAHLTHLDKEEFVERFITIVNSDNTSQEDMKEFSFGERVDQFNGRIITTQNSEPNRLVTSFDINETFTSLSAKGIRIEYSKLEEAFNKLGNSNKLAMWRYYWSLLIAIIFVYWVYALYKTALLCFEFQTIATSMICIILGCIGLVFSSVQISQRSVVIATEVLVNRWSDKVSIGFFLFIYFYSF